MHKCDFYRYYVGKSIPIISFLIFNHRDIVGLRAEINIEYPFLFLSSTLGYFDIDVVLRYDF